MGLFVSCVVLAVGFALAEAVVRAVDGNAFAQLDLFEDDEEGWIWTKPGVRTVRRPGGGTYTVHLDSAGLRTLGRSAAERWVIVGDSQVLGLGVEDGETAAAVASTPLRSVVPVAVPGWGVEDALRSLPVIDTLVQPRGVIVVVNQVNDWEEAGHPIETRFEARGGWLLPKGAPAWRQVFYGSPLSWSHLLHHAVAAISVPPPAERPVWLGDFPTLQAATARIGGAIRTFAAAHPELAVVVAYLPVDASTSTERAVSSPFARRMEGQPVPDVSEFLAREVQPLPVVDLTDALRDPACWLTGDVHLSPAGHAAVARALRPALDRATSGGAAP